jgi:hypothetical protein
MSERVTTSGIAPGRFSKTPAGETSFARRVLLASVVLVPILISGNAQSQSKNVAGTVHNLSVTGPGEIKSQSETEVCKFCHIPHNAVVPSPLWGQALSRVEHYDVPDIGSGMKDREPAPQPDGSSRLCLSCHDGTVALGEIAGGPPIQMSGSWRLTRDRPGFIGTDLSGSHPVSFVVPDSRSGDTSGERDMGIKPLDVILSDTGVRLDDKGKMQCTTCHNPHEDQFYQPGEVPHFWVKPTVEEVCLTCHEPL